MEQNNIPDIIKREAERLGFNRVTFSGHVDGADVYAVGSVDRNGVALPTGLPTFILYEGNCLRIVDGIDGLDLALKLD